MSERGEHEVPSLLEGPQPAAKAKQTSSGSMTNQEKALIAAWSESFTQSGSIDTNFHKSNSETAIKEADSKKQE